MYVSVGSTEETFKHLYLKSPMDSTKCNYRMVTTPRGIAYCEYQDARQREDIRSDIRVYSEAVFLIPFMEEGGLVTAME